MLGFESVPYRRDGPLSGPVPVPGVACHPHHRPLVYPVATLVSATAPVPWSPGRSVVQVVDDAEHPAWPHAPGCRRGLQAVRYIHLPYTLNYTDELGHLARIGPNDLVTDDPQIIRRISAVRSPYTRSDWYNATAFSHSLNHVFCERDEERHIELRNKLVPGVQNSSL